MVRRLTQCKTANGYVILKKHIVTATPGASLRGWLFVGTPSMGLF